MLPTAVGLRAGVGKVEEVIGRSEQAINRQQIAIAALDRNGQDARQAHELLRVIEDRLTAAHNERERLLDG